jgi:hypothetical protein
VQFVRSQDSKASGTRASFLRTTEDCLVSYLHKYWDGGWASGAREYQDLNIIRHNFSLTAEIFSVWLTERGHWARWSDRRIQQSRQLFWAECLLRTRRKYLTGMSQLLPLDFSSPETDLGRFLPVIPSLPAPPNGANPMDRPAADIPPPLPHSGRLSDAPTTGMVTTHPGPPAGHSGRPWNTPARHSVSGIRFSLSSADIIESTHSRAIKAFINP